jgi:hypothetical protein
MAFRLKAADVPPMGVVEIPLVERNQLNIAGGQADQSWVLAF